MKKFYPATISYIFLITFINVGFSVAPIYIWWGCEISAMDPVAGVVYLVRDFAQRELRHKIFLAMFVGAGLSYYFANPQIAFASVSAFIIGEIIDWGIFTFTQKPLSKRLIWSACCSTPVDSIIFLWGIDRFNILAALMMTLGKLLGVVIVWFCWYRTQNTHYLKST